MASKNRSSAEVLSKLGKDVKGELIDAKDPSPERIQEIIEALQKEGKNMTVSLLKQTQIGVTLGKAIKSIRRHKRHDADTWGPILSSSERLSSNWKRAASEESSKKSETDSEALTDKSEGLPGTVAVYNSRLTKQKKEMYKNPPVLPPDSIDIEDKTYPTPKRDKKTGALTFVAGEDEDLKPLLRDFHPNKTPEEILRAGAFGGTYFRPIWSAVTNIQYKASDVLKDTLEPSWIDGLDKKTMLTSSTYRNHVNKYGVKCGGSLGMWESSGWISDADPYGWFQWYCRFYQGRRCSDDERQISRWAKSAGPKGRFRSQLCNKILAAETSATDAKISPVIRQTLLHWGLEITDDILEQHKKRKK